jgi:hypothetical protein
MIDSTHDAILLIIAVLYVLVGLQRTRLYATALASGKTHRKPPAGWLSAPFVIATALAITAVLW